MASCYTVQIIKTSVAVAYSAINRPESASISIKLLSADSREIYTVIVLFSRSDIVEK